MRPIHRDRQVHQSGAKLMPRPDAISEPWTALGYLAAKNRFARMRLGVGVTDAGRRNPAVTAQAAATLHLLTRGRAILGIGTGEREGNEPYGVDWSKPVARTIEALATIRALGRRPGELVTRDSPFFPLRDAVDLRLRVRSRTPRVAHQRRFAQTVVSGDEITAPRSYAARPRVVARRRRRGVTVPIVPASSCSW